MTDGIVTVVGLANDGAEISTPYYQLVFDSDSYGIDSVGIEIGGILTN